MTQLPAVRVPEVASGKDSVISANPAHTYAQFSWAPDSRHLAYLQDTTNKEFGYLTWNSYIADVCSGTTALLVEDIIAERPDWRPIAPGAGE